MKYRVKGFSVVNEAEDVFLELPCFLHDAANVGHLISGSSASSKPSLYIWKFWVHVLLKPSLKDSEHNLASMWNECNYRVVWTFLVLPFFGTGMKTDFFQSHGHCWNFQICWLKSTRQTFVNKVKSQLFNMLSRFVIAFLPRSKCFFFHFMAAVTTWGDSGAKENKVCHCFHCFLIYLPWSDGTRCHDLSFLNLEF